MIVITLARRPLAASVADAVLSDGTGAVNVDGCRIPLPEGEPVHIKAPYVTDTNTTIHDGYKRPGTSMFTHKRLFVGRAEGRWPPNLILSCRVARFGEMAKMFLRTEESR